MMLRSPEQDVHGRSQPDRPHFVRRPSPSGISGIMLGGAAGAALGGPPGALVGALVGLAAGEVLEWYVPSESRAPRGTR